MPYALSTKFLLSICTHYPLPITLHSTQCIALAHMYTFLVSNTLIYYMTLHTEYCIAPTHTFLVNTTKCKN